MPFSKTLLPIIAVSLLSLSLCQCSSWGSRPDGAPSTRVNVANIKDPTPRPLAKSRYGNPRSYVVHGKRYFVLPSAMNYNQTGIASWYGTKFHGKLTSTREPYNMFAMTAASPVLPIPCYARVTNLENGKQIIVKVNDRGPFAPNRIIDLSYVAALKLGYEKKGTALVRVTSIDVTPPRMPTHRPAIYLQLGAFRSYQNAATIKQRAQHLTYRRVNIHASNDNGMAVYKVWVGPIKGSGDSDAIAATFTRAGYPHAFTVVR